MTTILLTGGSGQLGGAFLGLDLPAGVALLAPTRTELDLCEPRAVGAYLDWNGVGVVVNAAAYTAVDRAETDVAAAYAANTLAPAALAEATRGAKIPLVHVSTDYVFDGVLDRPYEVDDPVRPLGVYGASKAAGEAAVRLGNPRSAVVRTAWVVGERGQNFVRTMLRLGRERETVRVVADQHGAPTLASDLAAALLTVALKMARDAAAPAGLFHFANSGDTTWHGFAKAIFASARDLGLKTPRVEAIATADYPTPARRPMNSRLSTRRIAEDYGLASRPWAAGLPALVAAIAGQDDQS